jgi:3-phenylpropionate/trans-cinnamate dioxygenase ferredoxin reductase subunit
MTALGSHHDVVVVGGGHGGAQAAISLRQLGFEGSIAIVGAETEPPYERPPLSKEYFAGDKAFERLHLRPAAYWPDKAIDLFAGETVVSVDPAARVIATAAGRWFGYGRLVWAAGGAPRKLTCAGAHLGGVHSVRTRADIDRINQGLDAAEQVVVIGGGYIGLEAAAVLRKRNKSVTVLEGQDRVLARVAGETLSRFFEAEHRAHGVDLRLGVVVEGLEGAEKVSSVVLAGGERLKADLVIVGIGIVPQIEPLVRAGAEASDGVEIDARCRTTLADVFAIGDCARQQSRFANGARVRIESVPNVIDQAMTVAREMTGQGQDHDALPWFWSNQYDLRLQTAGLSTGFDETVLLGDPDSRSFSIVYFRGGRVIAVDAVNAAKDFMRARRWVTAGVGFEALS